MDPLTSYERYINNSSTCKIKMINYLEICFFLLCLTRSFVVKHHVFLLRNWELVRDRQIHLRIERERHHDSDEDEEEEEDDSHIKSGP